MWLVYGTSNTPVYLCPHTPTNHGQVLLIKPWGSCINIRPGEEKEEELKGFRSLITFSHTSIPQLHSRSVILFIYHLESLSLPFNPFLVLSPSTPYAALLKRMLKLGIAIIVVHTVIHVHTHRHTHTHTYVYQRKCMRGDLQSVISDIYVFTIRSIKFTTFQRPVRSTRH